MPYNKHIIMRIEDKDENGEGYLVIESKEDLEEFWKLVMKKAQEKAKARKPSYEAQPPK
ncbi:hypothetical protein SACC_32750 [Saccharolobus caldissimus]|uniref:Uncharacterized protein n=1 Tax=Saccharolobus caldissimus TaxID=1702097 RepID=A0AAQ4CWS7_9CREN|nr:hypothetical protein SACC_32750 [Saccharolobus caldissimus]